MTLTGLEIEYCNVNGWERHYGIWINNEMLNSDYDKMFFPEEMGCEVMSHGHAWTNDDGDDEGAYDDCDIIEHVEDQVELSFDEWKVRIIKTRSKKNG